jgi:hypothetical protein
MNFLLYLFILFKLKEMSLHLKALKSMTICFFFFFFERISNHNYKEASIFVNELRK